MKRIVGVAAALASLLATSAHAAPPSIYNWTGFYVGGNVGYSFGSSDTTHSFHDSVSNDSLTTSASRFNMDGVIGGGQAGYNWQRADWVFGFETDIQGSNQKGNTLAICAGGTLAAPSPFNGSCTPGHRGDTPDFNTPGLPVNLALSQKLEWFGTVRGRVGATVTPTLMSYVTGGLAYGEVTTFGAVSGTNITGPNGTNTVILTPVAGSFTNRDVRVGWTLGAGVEGMIGGGWTARAEYLYVDLGTVSGSFVTPITAPSGNPVTVRYSSHITDNIVRIGFNYRIGGGP